MTHYKSVACVFESPQSRPPPPFKYQEHLQHHIEVARGSFTVNLVDYHYSYYYQ